MSIDIGTRTIAGEWCDWDVAIVKSGEIYYPLTVCCDAVATGSDGMTCCRVCYQEVDSIFGICWTEEEFQKELFK